MNKFAIAHSIESNYSFPISKKDYVVRLRVSKDDLIDHAYVLHGPKHLFQMKRYKTELKRLYLDMDYAYYEVTLRLKDYRLAYIFEIESQGKKYYLSSDGLTEEYNFKTSYYNFFQMAYVNESDIIHEVSWVKDAIIYEIFVERFNRSKLDKNGDYITLKWNDKPTPKAFFGGTLNGIREKLNYLKKLGINTIYLTPIFKAPSNHKYDTIDYYTVDPQFGGEVAFKDLVEEIHKLGMRVILDAVFNHISDISSLFLDVKEKGKNSKYYNWFIIYGDIEKGEYEHFSICKYMPKLNTSNEEVKEYLIGIGKYYASEYKIDGWRLDVSDEISHSFWKSFRRELKAINKDLLLTGENWQDGTPYLRGDEFDGIMNYPFTKYINDLLAFNVLTPEEFMYKLNFLRLRYPTQIMNSNWNLLDSHDTFRFYTQVKKNENKALLGCAIQMFYTGIPCVYYGDEIPLEGEFDPDCRRGMDLKRINSKNEFFKTYKALIHLRRDSKIIKYGFLDISCKNDILSFKRSYKGNTIGLVMNLSKNEILLPKGKIILSNNTQGEFLLPYGFLVMREELN